MYKILILLSLFAFVSADTHVYSGESIQDAIDNAISGETIIVHDGIYTENLLIEKDLILRSENGESTTTIDGGSPGADQYGSAIVIRPMSNDTHHPEVEIDGFNIQNGKGTLMTREVCPAGGSCYNENVKLGGGVNAYVCNPKLINNKFKQNGDNDTDEGGGIFASSDKEDSDFSSRDYVDSDALTPATGNLDFSQNIFQENNSAYGSSVYVKGFSNDSTNLNGGYFDVYAYQVNDVSEYWVAVDSELNATGGDGVLAAITYDVWVDPNIGFEDSTTTGMEDDPFYTINYALSRIYSTEENPITINLAEGRFAPSINGEDFPMTMISNVNLQGQGEGLTILDAEEPPAFPVYYGSVLTISHCTNNIISDITITGGIGLILGQHVMGAGIQLVNSNSILEDITLMGNSGSAITVISSDPILTNVTIKDNNAENTGGIADAIYIGHITGQGFVPSNPMLNNVTISNNAHSGLSIQYGSATLTNVSIIGNERNGIAATWDLYLTLTNVTISGNGMSGIRNSYPGNFQASMTNCIIWDNGLGSFLKDQFINTTITYSDFDTLKYINCEYFDNDEEYCESHEGCQFECIEYYDDWCEWSSCTGVTLWEVLDIEGEGNINADPRFAGDYTLQEDSPCIDAGTADTDGDGYEDITDYFGQAPDMGAFEYEGSPSLSGDLNGDGVLNILDVVVLANIVLGASEPIDAGDLNGDGIINVMDIVILVNIILQG